jgi:hypothetical protein
VILHLGGLTESMYDFIIGSRAIAKEAAKIYLFFKKRVD